MILFTLKLILEYSDFTSKLLDLTLLLTAIGFAADIHAYSPADSDYYRVGGTNGECMCVCVYVCMCVCVYGVCVCVCVCVCVV